jgi:hypothetical protein
MDKYTSPHGLLFLCRARVPVDGNAGEKQIAFNVWGACGLSHFSGGLVHGATFFAKFDQLQMAADKHLQ